MEIPISPVPKPRMTQKDKWAKRPAVVRYFMYANELRAWVENTGYELKTRLDITFYLPMAPSWSEKKKTEFDGKYHQQRPDLDNLLKAFMDSLAKEDCHVAEVHAKKLWAYEGKIILEVEQ